MACRCVNLRFFGKREHLLIGTGERGKKIEGKKPYSKSLRTGSKKYPRNITEKIMTP